MSTYDDAQVILTDLIAIEQRIMPVIDPLMADVATEALTTLKNLLSNAFGNAAVTPDEIDQAARIALGVKFPGK